MGNRMRALLGVSYNRILIKPLLYPKSNTFRWGVPSVKGTCGQRGLYHFQMEKNVRIAVK